jgi:hypothetical protein
MLPVTTIDNLEIVETEEQYEVTVAGQTHIINKEHIHPEMQALIEFLTTPVE